jgi:hypothetical protein
MNLFGTKKTTASVMAGFHQMLADLREVEQEHQQEAEQHRVEAEQIAAKHEAAKSEAAAARTVAGRLESLLSTDAVWSAVSSGCRVEVADEGTGIV